MAPEEALSIATLSFKGIQEFLPVLAILGTGVLLFFSWVRVGTAHFLRERIWALLGGSKDFHDTYLNEQWKKVRDLETVRYRTGIRFQCRSKAADTFAWIDAHDIPLDDLLKSARYFDPSEIQVREPRIKAIIIFSSISIGLLILMMTAFIFFSQSSLALLTVKKTNTAVWTDGITVKAWDLRSWAVDAENCKADKVPIENEHDKNVVCELLTTDSKSFVENSLKYQKYLSYGLFFCLLVIAMIILRSLDQARAASRIYERTTTPQPRQLNMDFPV